MAPNHSKILLEQILEKLNQIDSSRKVRIVKIKNIKKESPKSLKQRAKIGFFSIVNKTLAPSIILSFVIFLINTTNTKNTSPLAYTLDLYDSVTKISSPDDDTVFTVSPFSTFSLQRNKGGLLENLFLVTVSTQDEVNVFAPIISNSKSDTYDKKQSFEFDGDSLLLWNQEKNLLNIFFPDTAFDPKKESISTAFIVAKGQNHSYSVITLLHKMGSANESYLDTTLTFTDLEIYDKRVWKEQSLDENYSFFITEYDKTLNKYQITIDWLKNFTL